MKKYNVTVGNKSETFRNYDEAINFIRENWFSGAVVSIVKIMNNSVVCAY